VPSPSAHVWDAQYLDGRTPVRRPARVSIGRNGLEIALTEDGRTFRWPLAEVRQTQGFYEGEQVRLERRGAAEALLVGDVRFLAAVRAVSPETAGAFRAPSRRHAVLVAGTTAALATVAVALALWAWGIPRLADVAATRVPVAWEVALGEATVAQLAPAAVRCGDPARQRRIDDIMDVLLRAGPPSGYPFRVIVVDRPVVNALATPGGFIVVFRGLLERTDNAEELAGVLAHEIQHVLHRDATRAILRHASTGVLLAALVGDVSGVVAFGVQTARVLGDLRYSRDAERAADVDGLRLLRAASVDPAGMLAFFGAMQKQEGAPGGAARYLSTHPPSADRLQVLRALAAAGDRPSVKLLPDYDWSDIRKICGSRR
jgi:predicted Zn-dependent protease